MDSNNNNENQNDLSNRNDEFFARLIRACGHNIILTELYKNITSENPDLNLDLSKSYNAELHDFITSLTGFLSMQNFETISSKLKNDDIDKIVNGNFRLKELTPAEFAAMTKDSKPPKIKNNVERYNLYTIQDGKYHIERKYGKAKLYLTTPTVEYFSKDQTTMSTKDIFHIIRNVVAHNGFYNYDSKLIYFNHDDYIKIPRMWLRGYAELFAKYASTFNTKEAASFK